jgi:hypothetical protein
MSLDVTASRIDPGAMKAEDCRGCRSRNLATLHDFGAQPLAGNYPLVPERVRPVSRYPLDLTR